MMEEWNNEIYLHQRFHLFLRFKTTGKNHTTRNIPYHPQTARNHVQSFLNLTGSGKSLSRVPRGIPPLFFPLHDSRFTKNCFFHKPFVINTENITFATSKT